MSFTIKFQKQSVISIAFQPHFTMSNILDLSLQLLQFQINQTVSPQDLIFLIKQPLLCYVKYSHFIPYDMHSLPVFISPILTSVVAIHY